MNDDDLERLLHDAFTAKANLTVPADAAVPSVDLHAAPRIASGRGRFLAPLATAAAVVLAVGGVYAARNTTTTDGHPAGGPGIAAGSQSGTAPTRLPTTAPNRLTTAVHVKLKWADGAQFGVGMPVIAYLSSRITDARAMSAATKVIANGKPVSGAWYFEPSTALRGYPLEAHYRLQDYWPGRAKISMQLPLKGLSAGPGLSFDDSLTLNFTTGPANIVTVDDASHVMTLVSDGVTVGSYPVSLGANTTPTMRGTKVIMEKGADVAMSGPGYHELHVKDTQRLTYSGEYLNAAPWNVENIGKIDTSNGCTNLGDADASMLYKVLEIGDVVKYPDASGPQMKLSDGFGDWNVSWAQWLTGGAVPTR